MIFGLATVPAAIAIALAATSAMAAPGCLGNGMSFEDGQYACLSVGGENYLARCGMVLNDRSWARVQDSCPGGAPPAPRSSADATSRCLANQKSFRPGQLACLTISGASHLARCDMVLNNSSWTKVQESCPVAPGSWTDSAPTEPTEN